MDTHNTEAYKTSLESELKVLETELNATGRKNPAHPGDWEARPDNMDVLPSDENEVADKLESYQSNENIMNQLEIRYNQVKEALARIEAGTFGTCKVCGKAIEAERLEANSAASTCIEHKDE